MEKKIWRQFYTSLDNLSPSVLILKHGSRINFINLSIVMNVCNLIFTSVDQFWLCISECGYTRIGGKACVADTVDIEFSGNILYSGTL